MHIIGEITKENNLLHGHSAPLYLFQQFRGQFPLVLCSGGHLEGAFAKNLGHGLVAHPTRRMEEDICS